MVFQFHQAATDDRHELAALALSDHTCPSREIEPVQARLQVTAGINGQAGEEGIPS